MAFTITAKETNNVVIAGSDVTFDIQNPQTNFVIVRYDYTKDIDTKVTVKPFINDIDYPTEWWQATVINVVDQLIGLDQADITDAGKAFFIVPVTMDAGQLKLNIVSDAPAGNGTFEILMRELFVRSSR